MFIFETDTNPLPPPRPPLKSISLSAFLTTNSRASAIGQCRQVGGFVYSIRASRFYRFTCPVLLFKEEFMRQRQFSDVEFVDLNLTPDQRDRFGTWYADAQSEMGDYLLAVTTADYRIGLSYDAQNNTSIASLTGRKEASRNANRCLTARAPEPLEALALLLYKHFVVADQQEWASAGDNGRKWG